MTTAIGAGQASVVAPAHTGSPKGGAAAKAHAKFAHDVPKGRRFSPRPTGHRDEADVDIGVKSTEKPSRRPHDESEKSDDHSNSFEATIDGIDHPAPQNAVTAAGPTADWNATLGMAKPFWIDRRNRAAGNQPTSRLRTSAVCRSWRKHRNTKAQRHPCSLLGNDCSPATRLAMQMLLNRPTMRSRPRSLSGLVKHTGALATRQRRPAHTCNGAIGKFRGGHPMADVCRDRIGEKRRSCRCNNDVGTYEAGVYGNSPVDAARDAPDQHHLAIRVKPASEPRDRPRRHQRSCGFGGFCIEARR